MTCALCGEPVTIEDRDAVRFSNRQPPWSRRNYRHGTAAIIAAMGEGFAEAVRTAVGGPEETFWFHTACWLNFRPLLNPPDSQP